MVLQKSIFLSINLFQNAKTYRKKEAFKISNTQYHLFNPRQTLSIRPFEKNGTYCYGIASVSLRPTVHLSVNIKVLCLAFVYILCIKIKINETWITIASRVLHLILYFRCWSSLFFLNHCLLDLVYFINIKVLPLALIYVSKCSSARSLKIEPQYGI